MGHRDINTTQIYADYAPDANEVDLINAAFAEGTYEGTNVSRIEELSKKTLQIPE